MFSCCCRCSLSRPSRRNCNSTTHAGGWLLHIFRRCSVPLAARFSALLTAKSTGTAASARSVHQALVGSAKACFKACPDAGRSKAMSVDTGESRVQGAWGSCWPERARSMQKQLASKMNQKYFPTSSPNFVTALPPPPSTITSLAACITAHCES